MNKKIKNLYLILFSLAALIFIVYFAMTRPVILVVNSYNSQYQWVQEVTIGFNKVIDHKSFYKIDFHYMDTKENPGQKFLEKASKQTLKLIDDLNPEVVVIFDDNAQKIVGKSLVGRKDIKVIYAGLDAPPSVYGYEKNGKPVSNVTGIIEMIPLEVMENLITYNVDHGKLPKNPRIAHLADGSFSVLLDDSTLHKLQGYVTSWLVSSKAQWQKAVLEAHKVCDLLLLSNYQAVFDDKGRQVPGHELVEFAVKNAKVPILGLNGFCVVDGANIAVGTSPFEQGRVAAEMLVGMVDFGLTPQDYPPRKAKEFLVYLRPYYGKTPRLEYPPIFESFARATGNYFAQE